MGQTEHALPNSLLCKLSNSALWVCTGKELSPNLAKHGIQIISCNHRSSFDFNEKRKSMYNAFGRRQGKVALDSIGL